MQRDIAARSAARQVLKAAKYWFDKTDTDAVCQWFAQISRENKLLKDYARERGRMLVYTEASGEFPVLARMLEK